MLISRDCSADKKRPTDSWSVCITVCIGTHATCLLGQSVCSARYEFTRSVERIRNWFLHITSA